MIPARNGDVGTNADINRAMVAAMGQVISRTITGGQATKEEIDRLAKQFMFAEDGQPSPLLAISAMLYIDGGIDAVHAIQLATKVAKGLFIAADARGHSTPPVILLDQNAPPRFVPVAEDGAIEAPIHASERFH